MSQVCVSVCAAVTIALSPSLSLLHPSIRAWYNISVIARSAVDWGNFERELSDYENEQLGEDRETDDYGGRG